MAFDAISARTFCDEMSVTRGTGPMLDREVSVRQFARAGWAWT
jgi:hypothetical protein